MAKWPHRRVFPLNQDEQSRFLSGFSPGAQKDCWPWLRSVTSAGYGQISVCGGMRLAHRVAWAFANSADIPRAVVICHRCDNPVCVNPSHLFPGDQSVNHWDSRRKGRASPPPHFRGAAHPANKLSEADVLAIRASNDPPVLTGLKYGVTSGYVRNLRAGRKWKHLI